MPSVRGHQPLGRLAFQHPAVAKEQVHKVILGEALVTNVNPDFSLNGHDPDGGTAGRYLALVQLFVEQSPKFVVNVERDSHDTALENVKCLLIARLDLGSDVDRHEYRKMSALANI